MSNKLSVTVDGVHEVGKKAYLTVDGKHRMIKKMYHIINGVHRLCYQLGIEWIKFSCNVTTDTHYTETNESATQSVGDSIGGESKHGLPNGTVTVYTDYAFDSDRGYYGIDQVTVAAEDIAGYYRVVNTQVICYTGSSYVEDPDFGSYGGYWYLYGYIDALATGGTSYYYSKGSTNYGTVYVEEGAIPDGGTRVSGSEAVGYCVVNVGGTYYYYEKV